MTRLGTRIILTVFLSGHGIADSEAGDGDLTNEPNTTNSKHSSFPTISSISSSDVTFSIPQPSLDLAPTNLAENSPMSFSIPSLELKLDETDFAKNAPMSFSITQPEFDLKPTFRFGQNLEEGAESKEGDEEETEKSSNQLPLEPQDFPENGENKRNRREAPDFPSIFSFRSSTDPFSIVFPSPDFSIGPTFLKFQDPTGRKKTVRHTKLFSEDSEDPINNEISNTKHDKRQVSFFNFRPSKLVSESNLRPSKPITRVKINSIHPKPSIQQTKFPIQVKGFKFGGLDPVLLLPPHEEVVRPVRQNRFRPPPRYPPFDPFNTTYIPLPGPSSPQYALPLSGGNPHMVSGAEKVIFRRPIRQSLHSPVLPSTKDLRSKPQGRDPENEVFKYRSSKQFEQSQLGKFFRSKSRNVPK